MFSCTSTKNLWSKLKRTEVHKSKSIKEHGGCKTPDTLSNHSTNRLNETDGQEDLGQ